MLTLLVLRLIAAGSVSGTSDEIRCFALPYGQASDEMATPLLCVFSEKRVEGTAGKAGDYDQNIILNE